MKIFRPIATNTNTTSHYIVVIPSSSPPFFLQIISKKPLFLQQSRQFSTKRGKEKDDGKIQKLDLDLDHLTLPEFIEKFESIIKTFPDSDSDPHFNYKRSVSRVYDEWMPIHHKFVFVKLSSGSNSIVPLFSKITFCLDALKYGNNIVVFQEKERFADICRHLVEVENIKLENIHYRSMSFDPDTVSYSFKQLKSSVVVLSNGVEALSSMKYEEASKCVDCLRRLSGLGLCFVMRDWASFFSYMVEFPMRKPRVPLERMISVRKNWAEISQFVHTGGAKKIKVLGVKITMARVRRILFVLHSKQRTREEKMIGRVGMPEPKIEPWVNPNPERIFPFVPNRKYSTHVPVFSFGGMLGMQRRPPVNLPYGSLSKLFTLLARGIR